MTSPKYILLFFFGIAGIGTQRVFSQTNLEGTAAPVPVLSTFSGQYQMLSKLYYAGTERPQEPRSVVVLNFMSLNCVPCQKELPQFLAVMRPAIDSAAKSGTPLKFFLVSLDPLSAKGQLRTFIEDRKIDLETELLLDPYHKAADKFGVVSIPRTVVITSRGVVAADIAGAVDDYAERLRGGVEAAFKGSGK
jgi:thiol-disulfide isomerase/thioredoxin